MQYIGKGKEDGGRETKNTRKRADKWAEVLRNFNRSRPDDPWTLEKVSYSIQYKSVIAWAICSTFQVV